MARRLSTVLYRFPIRLEQSATRLPKQIASWNQSHNFTTMIFKRSNLSPLSLNKHSLTVSRQLTTEPINKKKGKTVDITFIDRDGDEHTVPAKVGDTLLEVAKEFDIEVEGACEGTLSCSTCHLIVDHDWFGKIPDPLTEEEQDMLDLAYGLTDTSRLGCQIVVTKDLEGIRLTVPSETKDVRAS